MKLPGSDPPRPRLLTCRRCGGGRFYELPTKGICTLLRCADESCAQWHEAAPMLGHLEPADIEPAVDAAALDGPRQVYVD
ncbi:hypothetical protein ACTZWW_02345 [Salinarimonas sp. NSM]